LLGVRRAGAGEVRPANTLGNSRYVPRRVMREVYDRDAGQCAYVSADGRRCSARGFLEVHHLVAFALGGLASVENLRLACRAHNFWLAEREFGGRFMERKLVEARSDVFSAKIDGE
jgi:5-methylcytosine-specific restriction endonuclease McrA